MNKVVIILFTILISSVSLGKTWSVGPQLGWGSFSGGSWPLTAYGATVGLRGDHSGELGLNYFYDNVSAPSGMLFIQQMELDLRHRFGDKFGLFIGLPIIYFGSSNETILPSGMNLGLQAGYDFEITEQFSLGLEAQTTFARSYSAVYINAKFWGSTN